MSEHLTCPWIDQRYTVLAGYSLSMTDIAFSGPKLLKASDIRHVLPDVELEGIVHQGYLP